MTSSHSISKPVLRRLTLIKGTRKSKSGFSLVEVAIALAIISFAMIPMLGLLTGGLASLHSSINSSVKTEVEQQIRTSLEKMTASNLSGQALQALYYDSQGVQTLTATGSVYTVSIHKPVFPSTGVFSGQGAAAQIYQIDVAIIFFPGGVPGGAAAAAAYPPSFSIFTSPID